MENLGEMEAVELREGRGWVEARGLYHGEPGSPTPGRLQGGQRQRPIFLHGFVRVTLN